MLIKLEVRLSIKIQFATESDYKYIVNRDNHLLQSLLLTKINEKEIYIFRNQDDKNIGWMRYGYFWGDAPFMNMIWVEEEY